MNRALPSVLPTGRAALVLPAAAAAILGACGGHPASAQVAAPVYRYEVPAEQVVTPAPQEAPPYIEVTGSATVSLAPDQVRASFAVETRAAAAHEATARNAEVMDAVIRALKGSGITGVAVETFGYGLRPEYARSDDRSGGAARIVAYVVTNNVRATASDVAAAGRLIDAAVGAGANRVASLSFEASDTEPARSEALAAAVRSARMQAQAMAEALGRTLGPPLELHGGVQLPYPRAGGDVMFRAAEAVQTPIEAGDVSVSANVTVRFALGGPREGR